MYVLPCMAAEEIVSAGAPHSFPRGRRVEERTSWSAEPPLAPDPEESETLGFPQSC